MVDTGDLYELGPDVPEFDDPVMLCVLDGFVDAGGVGELVREQVLGRLDSQLVARFDTDRLTDFRSRRPLMTYVEDHWEGYESPELTLLSFRDTAGVPFLLLSGPEPDYRWDAFTGAVGSLVDRLGVRLTVGFHGIPMAVPHTRPIGLTAHATRPEMVAGYTRWLNRVQVPGSVAALLELRLGQAGHDAIGFAVHVPHYLAQAAYPAAALTAVDAVSAATGLSLPVEELREAARHADAQIERQVEGSQEIAAIVHTLEEQYDSFVATRQQDGPLDDGGDMPTAEELGAQFERFLAERERRRDGPDY